MAEPPADPAPNLRLRDLIAPVYLPTLFVAFGMGAVVPVIPLAARDFGASDGLVGVIIAMRFIGTTAFDLPAGVATARYGQRITLTAALLALILASVLGALSGGSGVLALAVFLVGAGTALFMTARLTYMAEAVPLARRGRALSLIGGTHRIGLFVGPVVGGFLADAFGLEAAFWTQAVAAGAALGVICIYLDPPAAPSSAVGSHRLHARVLATLSHHRRVFLTAGSAMVALTILRSARQMLLPLRGDDIGLGVAEIGLIFGISSAIDMTFFYPVGIVMDRWGRKWTAVPSLLLLSLAIALVPAADGFTALLLVGLLAGIGNGLGSGINMTLGTDFAPRDRAAEFLGVWRLLSDAGGIVSPFAIGFVAQAVAFGAATTVVAATGLGGALILVILVRETLRRGPVEVTAKPRSPPAPAEEPETS